MAKAQVRLYKQRSGHRDRELIGQTTIQEKDRRPTVGWIRSVIQRYFPEFVISDALILLSRTTYGYAAMRSCTPEAPDYYAFMFLEVTPQKDQAVKEGESTRDGSHHPQTLWGGGSAWGRNLSR